MDATLPSVTASLSDESCTRALSLTIVFHPQLKRIGECWQVPLGQRAVQQVLGRQQPPFRRRRSAPDAGRGLEEAHVSRQALILKADRCDGVVITREAGASRCLVGGVVLKESRHCPVEELSRGVSVQLGHAVVLWLRYGPVSDLDSDEGGGGLARLLGDSEQMHQLRRQIQRVAATDLDVLILGETGVGKELTASAIHQASHREEGPMVAINMSAIPVTLAPALLFGSERGAFTGAAKAQRGYFRQAQGGTLFLDEIGDTAAEIQPQLLRALQQREVQVVGGELEAVDIRVVAATDSDLDDSTAFDSALRHRLGCLEIHVPALREHAEDIGQLLMYFLLDAADWMGCEALLPDTQSDDMKLAQWAGVFRLFADYDWPGNVRELANAARQLLVASDTSLTLPSQLKIRLQAERRTPDEEPVAAGEVDDDSLRQAFVESDYEVAATARILGISRQAIYRRLSELPDLRLASDVTEDEVDSALQTANGDVRRAAQVLAVSYRGLRSRLRIRGADT